MAHLEQDRLRNKYAIIQYSHANLSIVHFMEGGLKILVNSDEENT
jgi:hypothetical protein